MSDFRFINHEERGIFWQYFWWVIGVAIVLSLVGFALNWLFLPAKILNPDEGLARWQWFYDTHEALNATAGNIQNATQAVTEFETFNGDPKGWNFQQTNEHSRLITVRNGYITHYNNLANQYNAKMRDITRNWASPPDLPSNIPNWGQ